MLQQPVQLEINSGESVTFYLNCKKGCVNLTGFYADQDMDDDEAGSFDGSDGGFGHVVTRNPNC